MQKSIHIEPMNESHIEEIYEIEKDCFSSPWSKEQFSEMLNSDFAFFRVAKFNAEVIGYIGLYCVLDEGQITNVAVKKDFRKQGVAKMLFEYIKNEAIKRGIKIFTLEVRISNEPAINLYKKLGFKKDGIRADFYENPIEDALLMSLKINA